MRQLTKFNFLEFIKMKSTAISETTTENIFRNHYGAGEFIEKSAIPKYYGFQSKKGTNNKGYPDFLKI